MADQTAMPEYAPAFSIQAEGKDITRVLQECLSELTLTDYGGATAKAACRAQQYNHWQEPARYLPL